jgi:hypothetical protein
MILAAVLFAAIPLRPSCVVFDVDRAKSEITVASVLTGALLKIAVPRRAIASLKTGDEIDTHDEFRRGVTAKFLVWNGSGVEVKAPLRDVVIAAPFCCTATTDRLSGLLAIRNGDTTYDAIVLAGDPPTIDGARTAIDFDRRIAFIKVKGLTLGANLLPPVIEGTPSRPFRVIGPLKSDALRNMRMAYSDMKRVLLLTMRKEAREKKADAVTDVNCIAVAHATRFRSPLTCTGNAIVWTDAQ